MLQQMPNDVLQQPVNWPAFFITLLILVCLIGAGILLVRKYL